MKFVIIEDQTLIRQMLVGACRQAMPEATVWSAATGAEGLELCRREKPELVLLDLVLPDADGLDLAADIRGVSDETKILVISSHTDDYTVHRVQGADVQGFVDKNVEAVDILGDAFEALLGGGTYFCAGVREARARLKADPQAFTKVLSDREMELLALIGQGLDNEEIGGRLGLRPNTVRNHRQNIMAKLGLGSTPQLIRFALEKGFTRLAR